MKEKLNIAYLDFDDLKNPLLGAGQARATYEVATRLTQKSHSVEIFCSKYPGYSDRVERGIRYTHVGLGSKFIRLNNLAYIFLLPFYVRKIKADLIVECFTAPISTLFSPLFTKIPVVAITPSFEAERFSKKYHLPFYLIERFGLRFYEYFLPSSPSFEAKMKEVNPNVVSKVIPQGISEDYFSIRAKSKGKYIVYLGRLDMGQKGLDLLLKAFSRVSDSIDYSLVIAGYGADEEKIAQLIEKLKLEKKVKMVGPVFGKKKKKILSQAVFAVIPSRYEGFCLVALEALASGLPIVAFNIAGISWLPKNVSFKAKPFEIEDFAKLLAKMARKDIDKKLRDKCIQVAKKYSWKGIAKQYEQFFKFMINRESSKEKDRRNITFSLGSQS